MPAHDSDSARDFRQDELAGSLGEALDAILDFTGATAGWLGLLDAGGRLTFPVRRGEFAPGWLALQQGQAGPWGFEVREGPSLLNHLPELPALGGPALMNLLSCPLQVDGSACGQVALANKPRGFTSHDAAVLQGVAHLMGQQMARAAARAAQGPNHAPALPEQILHRLRKAVVVIDEAGTLVFANATWLNWTQFAAEDLLRRPAPFPFWVSHRELAGLAGQMQRSPTPPDATGAHVYPFRRRDGSVFWCSVEVLREEIGGRPVTVAFLRQPNGVEISPQLAPATPTQVPQAERLPPTPPLPVPSPEWLALLLHPGGGVNFWGEDWERQTGLTTRDVAGAAPELLLDWLFPVQSEREWVADQMSRPKSSGQGTRVVLHVLDHGDSRPMTCTFLPVPVSQPALTATGAAAPRLHGWLLLAADFDTSTGLPQASSAQAEAVRADTPAAARGPHAMPERPAPSGPARDDDGHAPGR